MDVWNEEGSEKLGKSEGGVWSALKNQVRGSAKLRLLDPLSLGTVFLRLRVSRPIRVMVRLSQPCQTGKLEVVPHIERVLTQY